MRVRVTLPLPGSGHAPLPSESRPTTATPPQPFVLPNTQPTSGSTLTPAPALT